MEFRVKEVKNITLLYPYDPIIVGYFFLFLLLTRIFQFHFDYGMLLNFLYDGAFLFLFFLSAIVLEIVSLLKQIRSSGKQGINWASWGDGLRKTYLNPQKFYEIFRILFLLKFVLLLYCNIKQAIPRINPHVYDQELFLIDAFLHFGINPNRAAVDFFGSEFTVLVFDGLYFFWYILKAPMLVFFLVVPDERTRVRFFGSYFSMWIIGGLFALIFPSFGPVYITPEIFVHLEKTVAHTLQVKLMSHYLQLIADPDTYRYYIYEGIAAFPSLHVGIVALFSFFLFRVHKLSGVLMALYTVCVLIGSVLLGWHYAVDGYFSIALAYGIYRFSYRGEEVRPLPAEEGRRAGDERPPEVTAS